MNALTPSTLEISPQMPSLLKRLSAVLVMGTFCLIAAFPALALERSVASEAPHLEKEEDIHHRVAARLQLRVQRRFGINYSVEQLAGALEMRSRLLSHSVSLALHIEEQDKTVTQEVRLMNLQEHPEWMLFEHEKKPVFVVDDRSVRQSLADHPLTDLPPVSHSTARSITEKGITRAEILGDPKAGYAFDIKQAATALAEAFNRLEKTVSLSVAYEQPTLFVVEDSGIRELTLLSSGKSNYKGSPYGRRQNVDKAFLDHLQGAVIKPGADFSFNDALQNPISGNRGWADALVIVNGKDLVKEPGGGICQAATTVFRAALLAGLPVIQRANHSLYVTYYKKYGVGIDATYYPGKQDFVFNNNTGDMLVLVTRADGMEASVDVFGIPDGRTVDFEGPYFAANAPEGFLFKQRELYSNEIAWKYTVTGADGHVDEQVVASRYLALPKKLHLEYPENRGIGELTGTYYTQSGSSTVALAF